MVAVENDLHCNGLLTARDDPQLNGVLTAKNDNYGGIMVEVKGTVDCMIFGSWLSSSLSQWRQQGKKGIWVKLPIGFANLVEATVKEGFWYHHAEPDYIMVVNWIAATECTLPENASHRVKVGAFILNKEGEVLVVQEKLGFFKGKGIWKLPTGALNMGEDICEGIVREVKEETGIDSEFVEILAFSQKNRCKSFFGKSELLFICMLTAHSYDIHIQESEIDAAQWMNMEEFASQPFIFENEMFNFVTRVCVTKMIDKYAGFSGVSTRNSNNESSFLYLNTYTCHVTSSRLLEE